MQTRSRGRRRGSFACRRIRVAARAERLWDSCPKGTARAGLLVPSAAMGGVEERKGWLALNHLLPPSPPPLPFPLHHASWCYASPQDCWSQEPAGCLLAALRGRTQGGPTVDGQGRPPGPYPVQGPWSVLSPSFSDRKQARWPSRGVEARAGKCRNQLKLRAQRGRRWPS